MIHAVSGRAVTLVGSRAFRTGLAVLVAGSAALFSASLLLRGEPGYDPLWDGWVATVAMLCSALACLARAILGGPRRAAAAWLGVGMLSFTAGNVIYVTWTALQPDPPVPSAADIAFLAFYPCAVAAVVCLVRRDEMSSPKSLWLDGALGAAGAATALAVVLDSVVSGIHGDLGEVLVGAAFPVGDLLLVATICGLLAARGLRGGAMWLWLAGGFAVFCVADVTYALRLVAHTYVLGTIVDALWVVALALVAFALWRPERPAMVDGPRSTAILAVAMLATVTAVVVLVISSIEQLSIVIVALAAFTLGLAAVRTLVGFRQVQRHSDARRQAVTDELTGLGNRRYLFERGDHRLQTAAPSDRIMLMMIDLDNFKAVNDALGHDGGDELLRETARRLAACVNSPALLVRLGGDEFALVITLATGEGGRRVAEDILDRLSLPLVIEGVSVRAAASAGVAERTSGGDDISEMLRRADLAMYAAKAAGSRIERYDPQLDENNRTRLDTIQDLGSALARHQFVLHYQPKIDVRTGVVIGAEALVRWEHPTRGLLYPDSFLPIVEQSGLMGALTEVVLEAAIRQLASWRATGLTVTVAVNLSASDLLDEHLAERIEGLLAERGLAVGSLELEITESVLMTDPERARRVLDGLRGLGLRIAVDDYGTGYSALAYLRDLPVDELKIDRSFVAHVTRILAAPRSCAPPSSSRMPSASRSSPRASNTRRRWRRSPASAATTRRASTSAARCPRTISPTGLGRGRPLRPPRLRRSVRQPWPSARAAGRASGARRSSAPSASAASGAPPRSPACRARNAGGWRRSRRAPRG